MSIICKNGPEHQHESVIESKICWGVIAPAPKPVVAPPTSATLPNKAPSPAQLDLVEKLGGDRAYAAKLEGGWNGSCSKYITRLKGGSGVSSPATSPVPREKTESEKRLDMIAGLIGSVPSGYYAVRPEEGAAIYFMRISRPEKGKYNGALKVQKVIGNAFGTKLEEVACYWPSKRWSVYSPLVVEKLMLLIADSRTAALLYGKEIGRCCRCNAVLTDKRSRHYSIGPDCEEFWPHIIESVDERNDGHTYEWLAHRGLAER